MSTILIFDCIENKHDVYRGEDCMKTFFESLTKDKLKIINLKKKENDTTKEKEDKSYLHQTNPHICKKSLKIDTLMIQNIVELET